MRRNLFASLLVITSLPLLGGCYAAVGFHNGWHHHYRDHGYWRELQTNEEFYKWGDGAAQELAENYSLNLVDAKKLVAVLNDDRPEQQISTLGLSVNDFAPLKKLEMPSNSVITKVARALNASEFQVYSMMQDYIDDMSAEDQYRVSVSSHLF